jgi:hypothetical protein
MGTTEIDSEEKGHIMQHLCTDEFKKSSDEDTLECAEEILLELRAVNHLCRLTKSSWSPTLKANAAALEARKQKLALQLNAWRERTCADFRSQHHLRSVD